MKPMLTTCQTGAGELFSWNDVARSDPDFPDPTSSSTRYCRGSCVSPVEQTQAVKEKVVAGTVLWGVMLSFFAGALPVSYCKYSAVSVSD
jgi:hypothetical protein